VNAPWLPTMSRPKDPARWWRSTLNQRAEEPITLRTPKAEAKRGTMHADVGDWLVVKGATLDDVTRKGEIVQLVHEDGACRVGT
jgi:hypothetical protein